MKGIIRLALCISAIFIAGAASAHQYVRVQQMFSPSGTGYSAKKLVWHDNDYSDAQPYQGTTNFGPWSVYPIGQPHFLPANGWIGPIAVNRWYKVKFISFLFNDWSERVFAWADICSPIPAPIREQ